MKYFRSSEDVSESVRGELHSTPFQSVPTSCGGNCEEGALEWLSGSVLVLPPTTRRRRPLLPGRMILVTLFLQHMDFSGGCFGYLAVSLAVSFEAALHHSDWQAEDPGSIRPGCPMSHHRGNAGSAEAPSRRKEESNILRNAIITLGEMRCKEPD